VAVGTVEEVTAWQHGFTRDLGVNFLYLGDEFYLTAGRAVPEHSAYDGFPLVENGVGMVRRFVDAFHGAFRKLERVSSDAVSVKLVTGVLGQEFLTPLAEAANRLPWLSCRVVPVRNRFFGDGVTVSGLLTGKDILGALQADANSADVVVLPPNCVNHEGILLDDLEQADLENQLGLRVVLGSYDLAETLGGLVLPSNESARGHSGFDVKHPYIASHQMEI
jgi:NifB/MoaA-like Fe-S oxidoreductase